MTENYHFVVKAKRKASSLIRLSIRAKKVDCLHNDVEYFISKRDPSLTRLVAMLLNNDFIMARYTDPTYPIRK